MSNYVICDVPFTVNTSNGNIRCSTNNVSTLTTEQLAQDIEPHLTTFGLDANDYTDLTLFAISCFVIAFGVKMFRKLFNV